jgi:acyl dehydratase
MPQRIFTTIADLQPHVGQKLAVSDWLTVSQERIGDFAKATDDYQWIHTDPDRAAREAPSRTTVAHGYLTLSLLAPMFATAMAVEGTSVSLNYGLNRVRFTAPVLAGDRIRSHFTLQQYTDLQPGAQLTWNVVVEREGGEKPALIAEWIMRRYP